MKHMTDFIIIVIAVLGFLFPSTLISAIRSENENSLRKYKTEACFCFALIVFLISVLINS